MLLIILSARVASSVAWIAFPGRFSAATRLEKVSRIYKTLGSVIAIAKEQHIATNRAADVLAEQHIAMMRQVKTL